MGRIVGKVYKAKGKGNKSDNKDTKAPKDKKQKAADVNVKDTEGAEDTNTEDTETEDGKENE